MMCIITINYALALSWQNEARKYARSSGLFLFSLFRRLRHGRRIIFFQPLSIRSSYVLRIHRSALSIETWSWQLQIYIAFMMKHVACLAQKIKSEKTVRLCGVGPARLTIYVHEVSP